MFNLFLCILFSSSLYVIFKLFSKYRIQTLYAIITNYATASIIALVFYGHLTEPVVIFQKPWFFGALLLAMLFITVFKILATTTQLLGVSVASVASKMSLVIPVILGVVLYDEQLGWLNILGIILALGAVYFTSIKNKTLKIKWKNFILPLLLFIGSGLIDSGLKYMQFTYISDNELPLFSQTIFGLAFCLGILYILLNTYKTPLKINLRNCIAGVILGIFNYFTIHFLLEALNDNTLTSASIFTIINVGTVLLSTFLGILLFKEKLLPKNWLGIILAITSIILMTLF